MNAPYWLEELDGLFDSEMIKRKETYVKKMSQDYYWYSPVLRAKLAHYSGDCVLAPKSEEELINIITFAAKRKIPIVTRGGGTGNYGQIIPLRGGIVLDTRELNKIVEIESGQGTFEAGVKLGTIEKVLKETDQELRFFPSTFMKSTIAGFIAGGTGGIGSIAYGTLWDEGNILALTVLTMEETPRKINVKTKEELAKYIHSYGISGIILEATIALAKKVNWVDFLIQFDELEQALLFSDVVAHDTTIQKRLVSVCEAPLSTAFHPIKTFTDKRKASVLLQIAPEHQNDVEKKAACYGGDCSAAFSRFIKQNKLRMSDFSWNHVTLWWLKLHPNDTYLQGRFDPKHYVTQVNQLKERYQDEVLIHFEWIRAGGKVVPSSQPVIRFTTVERLQEIMVSFQEFGIKVSNPHTFLLEEGGKDEWMDQICLAKKENDPNHLLNPGKTHRTAHSPLAGETHV
ncbi:FAD-binding oxidoreductase [Halalkalibacter alkalisediminis]|uniref:FAD-binding oxidoreductase n=1 Tax=Halalkalibacter alkalisediminis TaxID=935616 RepID=A0ABV6NFB9_9BACI|nr:FAD-binding oxidoreductase [Halalkalibacter alkalisediminis]